MNTYEENLKALEDKSLQLKDALLKFPKDNTKSEKIEIEQAKTGDYISCIIQDEKKKYLGSRYNPIHEAERWAQQFQFNSDENVIGMLGFGTGYFLRELIQLEQVKYVIVYEPDIEVFYHTMQHYDLSDVLASEKVVLIVKELNEELSIRLMSSVLNLNNVKSLQTAIHPGYENDYEAEKKTFLEQLLHVQKTVIMYLNTNTYFGMEWMENTLHNMCYLRESNTGHEFMDVLNKKIPVIAVMAGPSVADAIEDLKMAKGVFPIFAVDRIANFLVEHGVEPDAVFTVDAMIDFDIEQIGHIPLVGCLESRRLLFARHTGKKILINHKKFPGEIYVKLNKSGNRYEAANTISSLLMGMLAAEGIENIILVGQDLAFRGDVSHADGSEEKLNRFDNDMFVEGLDGKKIRTRSDWVVMLNWYKGFLAAYPNCTVYDSKDVGAKIPGTKQKKIRELLAENQWEKRDYVKCFNELEPTFNEKEWEQVLNYLVEVDNDMDKILKVLPEAIEATEYFLKNSAEKRTKTRTEKNLTLMKETNQCMIKGSLASMVSELIEAHLGKELLELNQKEDTFDKKEEKVYGTVKQMYTGMDSILKSVQPKYKEMLQMLQTEKVQLINEKKEVVGVSELSPKGNVLKIALLVGKIKNAGDYLIAERTKQLLKSVYPECEINEYIRVYRLEPQLSSLNSNDIAVIAGGPALLSGNNPLLALEDLSQITIPIFTLGVGWFGADTKPDILYRYELSGVNLELFKRIATDTKTIGCRDMASVNVLRNSGLECGLLTGCPAWYDLEKVQSLKVNKKLSGKIGKVCISDPANPGNMGKFLEVIQYVHKFVAPEEIIVVFHRGIASNVESYQIVLKYLEENQIAYFDIANDWVGFKHYDDADLHIGFRVHAHLYNLSKRNISVLISEDGRGLAANETLGLPIIRPYNNLVLNEGKFMAAPNEYLVYQLDDVIKNMIDTDYYELERAFETMNHYYQNMTKHISTMKDFVR